MAHTYIIFQIITQKWMKICSCMHNFSGWKSSAFRVDRAAFMGLVMEVAGIQIVNT